MIYDYIIAGSGIAGNICAYQLSRYGKSCLILEKEKSRKEKVCGGGVPFKALEQLRTIEINIDDFFINDVSMIHGDKFFYVNKSVEHEYKKNVSLGTRRALFDDFLLKQALNEGAIIRYGEKVNEIKKDNELFMINNYLSHKFICAVGARGISNKIPAGQSIGVSAHILGTSTLDDDKLYFWYYEKTKNKYFWIFPIGKKRWNVGIWFRTPSNKIKEEFRYCILNILDKYFPNGYLYTQEPKGEFLGNVDQCNYANLHIKGIGDFAGKNNIKNGGGILSAIESAIQFAKNELQIGG